LKWKIEGRLQNYVQHSLNIYYSVYTSVRVFNPPDQGKTVTKLLKLLMTTFVKKTLTEKISMPKHFATFILFGRSTIQFSLQ